MAVNIGSLLIKLGLDSGQFKSGLNLTEREFRRSVKRIQGIGQDLQGLGQKMSVAVTAPIIALGVASVKAAIESREALGQVEAALKTMGGTAGRTSEQLQAMATGLMRQSLFDDDEILRKVTANLLTFGNVAGEQFDRAQAAAVDLAARMGTDLQSATIMIGKALNDPAKGLAALRRVGIQFTEQQQDQIKAMAAAGNAAGAQRIMLAELERQFGGSAQAMRDANPAAAMKQAWDELQETIGAKLLPLLPRLADAVTAVLDAFGKLSPGMQTAVIAGAGLAAVLGPVLMALGGLVQVAAPLIALLSAAGASAGVAAGGFGALAVAAAPFIAIAAAVAAAGYLIYQNWDKIAPVLERLWGTVSSTLGPPLQRLIDSLKVALTELWQGPLGAAIRAVMPYLAEFGLMAARVLGTQLVKTIEAAAFAIGLAFDAIALSIRVLTALFDGSLGKIAIDAVKRLYTGVKTWLQDRLAAVFDWIKGKLEAVGGWFFDLYDAVVGHSYIPDMVDGIAAHMGRLEAVMVVPAKKAAASVAQAMREAAEETRALLDRLFPEVGATRQFNAETALIDRSGLSEQQKIEARRRQWSELVTGNPLGAGPLSPGILAADPIDGRFEDGLERFNRRMEEFGKKASETTVRVAKSFKDMAQETMGALRNLADAIKGGGFLDILEAVVGFGLQLGSMGVFGKKIATSINASVPGYAAGTNFHPGGYAVVGESGPELLNMPRGSQVVPNHALGGLNRPTVVQLLVDEGGLFEPKVRAISGSVSVEQVTRAGRGAMRQQRQAI